MRVADAGQQAFRVDRQGMEIVEGAYDEGLEIRIGEQFAPDHGDPFGGRRAEHEALDFLLLRKREIDRERIEDRQADAVALLLQKLPRLRNGAGVGEGQLRRGDFRQTLGHRSLRIENEHIPHLHFAHFHFVFPRGR